MRWRQYTCVHSEYEKMGHIFNRKKIVLPPSTFQSGEGPQLIRLWSDINKVRTADSYGASEFILHWSFSGVCVAQSLVFCVFVRSPSQPILKDHCTYA